MSQVTEEAVSSHNRLTDWLGSIDSGGLLGHQVDADLRLRTFAYSLDMPALICESRGLGEAYDTMSGR